MRQKYWAMYIKILVGFIVAGDIKLYQALRITEEE